MWWTYASPSLFSYTNSISMIKNDLLLWGQCLPTALYVLPAPLHQPCPVLPLNPFQSCIIHSASHCPMSHTLIHFTNLVEVNLLLFVSVWLNWSKSMVMRYVEANVAEIRLCKWFIIWHCCYSLSKYVYGIRNCFESCLERDWNKW